MARYEQPLPAGPAPRCADDELLGLMPVDGRKPVDMREVIARVCDDSDFMRVPGDVRFRHRVRPRLDPGMPVGFITNNGPLDPAGSVKATHFIQQCCQNDLPIVYLQNTTGYIVGTRVRARRHDQARLEDDPGGRVRDRAASDDPVRRVVRRRQLRHVRTRLRAALPVRLAQLAHRRHGRRAGRRHDGDRDGGLGARQGLEPDRAQIDAMRAKIVETFERQTSAFYTSGRMLDDGIIDPRDTRRVLAHVLHLFRARCPRRSCAR